MHVHLDHESPASNDDPEPASPAEEPPERARGLSVDVTASREAASDLDQSKRAWLADHASRIGEQLDLEGELRVRIVGDAEMAAAHDRHLGDPTTTDVLTFDLADGSAARGAPVDADLMVCLDEATRRAAEHGHAFERELLLYVVHGLLHCLGHDDHDEASFQRMHTLEDELLEAVGVGATFSPARGGSSA